MKILDQEKMERIKALLKTHPRGLSITQLSSITGLNRNLIAKYLDMLVISGQVEFQQYGPAKVYFLSQRIPITAMIEITSDLVMVLDQDRKIVQVNKSMTGFLGMPRETLVGKTPAEVGHPFLSSIPLTDAPAADGTEGAGVSEITHRNDGRDFFFRVKRAPSVFEDGSVGLTLIMEDVTEQRRYQENLRLNESRYRGIVQDQTEFINRFLPDTTITFANEALSQYLGCRPEDLVGKRALDMIPGEEQEKLRKALEALTPENPTGVLEHRVRDGRGQIRWVLWTNRAIFDDRGTLREFQGIGRDITEQKETADRISQYILQLEFISRMALEFVHLGPEENIYEAIAGGVKSLYPEATVCVHSYEKKTDIMTVKVMLDEEARNRIRGVLGRDPVGNPIHLTPEVRSMAMDGKIHRISGLEYLDCFVDTVPDEGRSKAREAMEGGEVYLMGLTYLEELFGDVVLIFGKKTPLQHQHLLETYLNQASVAVQRRVFEEELGRSREEYRRIVENADEGIWVLDKDYRTTFVNRRLAEMLGYAPEELVGTQIEVFMLQEDIPAHHQRIAERRTGMSGRFEQRFRKKDGSLIWVMANATPLFESGEFAGAFAMVTDITVEKHAEEALRESEGKYRALVEQAHDMIAVVQDGLMKFCNQKVVEMWGGDIGEILGQSYEKFIDTADLPRVRENYLRRMTGETVSQLYDITLVKRDGTRVYADLSAGTILYDGRPADLILMRDISAKKKAEDALRESEEKYRTLVERSNDGIVVVQDGKMQFCNGRAVEMWGGDIQEILGQPYEKFIPPGERERIQEAYGRRLAGEDISNLYDTRLLKQDGGTYPVDLNAGTIIYDGRPADLIVFRDITERKKAEEELKRTHELQQAILWASPVGIGLISNHTLVWANDAMYRIQGIEPGSMKGQHESAVFADKEEYERVSRDMYKGIEQRDFGEAETFLSRLDGSRVDVSMRGAPIRPGSQDIIVVVTDITARKKAEEELRKTYELQQAILAASPMGIGVTSNRVLVWANEAMSRIHGYGPGEREGQSARMLYEDDQEYERVTQEISRAMETGEFRVLETVWRRKDGSRANIRLTVGPVRPGSPEVLSVARDITTQKKAAEELTRTQVLQEAILRASPVGIGLVAGRSIIWENEAMCRILGVKEGELKGQSLDTIFIDEGEYTRASRLLDQAIKQHGSGEVETVWKRKDGSRVEVSLRVAPVQPGSPEVIGVATDITDRKQAERALRESEETFRTMVSINPLPLSLIDATGKYIYVNPSFTRLFGYTLEDIPDGKAWFAEAFPEEKVRETARRLWKADASEHPAGEVRPRTFQVRCRDGSSREILFLPASTPAGLQVVVYQDLTDAKIHARLRESEDEHRHMVDDLNIGIYRSTGDPSGRFVWGNTGLVSILGYESLADLQGIPVRDLFIRPKKRETLLEELREKKFVKNRLLTLRRKDGTQVTVSVTALAEFDEKGKVRFINGLVQETGRE